MKIAILLLLTAFVFPVMAQDDSGDSAVISVSPDHRYEVFFQNDGDALCVRDTRTKAVVSLSDNIDAPYSVARGATVIWSPDNKKFIISYDVSKNGDEEHFLLALKGSKLVELHLPKDAIPIKWTGPDSVLCSVRVNALLKLDSKTGTLK